MNLSNFLETLGYKIFRIRVGMKCLECAYHTSQSHHSVNYVVIIKIQKMYIHTNTKKFPYNEVLPNQAISLLVLTMLQC